MTKIVKNILNDAFGRQKLRLFMNKRGNDTDEKAEDSDDLSDNGVTAYSLSDNNQ